MKKQKQVDKYIFSFWSSVTCHVYPSQNLVLSLAPSHSHICSYRWRGTERSTEYVSHWSVRAERLDTLQAVRSLKWNSQTPKFNSGAWSVWQFGPCGVHKWILWKDTATPVAWETHWNTSIQNGTMVWMKLSLPVFLDSQMWFYTHSSFLPGFSIYLWLHKLDYSKSVGIVKKVFQNTETRGVSDNDGYIQQWTVAHYQKKNASPLWMMGH